MDRLKIIQSTFDNTDFKNYLEIGCFKGKTFFKVKASNKIAIDPAFHYKFTLKKWLNGLNGNSDINHFYFKEESDTFFSKRADFLQDMNKIDIAFIDGLHTFRASLKDVLHSLKYLNSKGFIIMHDCFPPNETAAMPTAKAPTREEKKNAGDWTGEWCGDVWKSIYYLKSKFTNELSVSVIDAETGLGMVRPITNFFGKDLSIDEELFESIDKMTYKDLKEKPKDILNLVPKSSIDEIIADIIQSAN